MRNYKLYDLSAHDISAQIERIRVPIDTLNVKYNESTDIIINTMFILPPEKPIIQTYTLKRFIFILRTTASKPIYFNLCCQCKKLSEKREVGTFPNLILINFSCYET